MRHESSPLNMLALVILFLVIPFIVGLTMIFAPLIILTIGSIVLWLSEGLR